MVLAAPRAQHPANRPTTLHSGLVDLTVGIECIIPNPHSARYAGQTLQEGVSGDNLGELGWRNFHEAPPVRFAEAVRVC